jgi:hypothetical protein
MRKPLLSLGPVAFAAAVLGLALMISLPIASQEERAGRHLGMVHDWSARHAVYARSGRIETMLAAQRDPRAAWSWLRAWSFHGGPRPARTGLAADWSINLGAAGTAAAMSPAKFTFDVNATVSGPANTNSCLNDFVVYPINVAGSATQPNIVAFNNLYSGTAPGPTGICNRTSGSGTLTSATVLWSYNVSAIGGAVPASPVIYFDPISGATNTGQKVAFVESAAGSPAHFHVLAWKSGDGFVAGNPQTTLQPVQITTFVSTAPAAGSGTATDLPLGSSTSGTDTLSSPFVDYVYDKAYVGNDAGQLFRINDVFCTEVNPAYLNCNAPSLDTDWGTGGVVTVGPGSCSGTTASRLTGPVLDYGTMNVYVGCADGKLYGFNPSGVALSPGSVTVGEGIIANQYGGIVDPPIVDGVNGFVYAVSGSNGTNAVLVQTTKSFSSTATATLGARRVRNLYAPTFNDAYFSSATSGNWVILSCGYNAGGTNTDLYAVGFNATRVMNAGTPPAANTSRIRAAADECSPLTEFLNGARDWLFLARIGAANVRSFDIASVTGSAGFPGGFAYTNTAAETGGTSAIVVDNVSAANQASSIYFSRLGSSACGAGGTGRCAVKLTQATFY